MENHYDQYGDLIVVLMYDGGLLGELIDEYKDVVGINDYLLVDSAEDVKFYHIPVPVYSEESLKSGVNILFY